MKYIATFEVSPQKIDINLSEEVLNNESLKNLLKEVPLYLTPTEVEKKILPNYMQLEISEETFKFINSVAKIEHERYGERTYIINNIRFTIEEKE